MRFERVLIYFSYGVTITAYFVCYSGYTVAALLMYVRAVQGMTLFRPSTVTDVFAFSKQRPIQLLFALENLPCLFFTSQ